VRKSLDMGYKKNREFDLHWEMSCGSECWVCDKIQLINSQIRDVTRQTKEG